MNCSKRELKMKSIVGLSLCCLLLFSCTQMEEYDGDQFIGEYVFVDSEDGKIYEAFIYVIDSRVSWYASWTGVHGIRSRSFTEFDVLPYESWNFYNTLNGRLENDRLFITQNVYDFVDRDLLVSASHRAFIKQ